MKVQRVIGSVALGAYILTAFTPVANWSARAVRTEPDIRHCDAVVAIGSAMSADGTLSADSLRGAVRAVTLMREGMAPVVLMMGMRTSSGVSEAGVRARLAREFGVRDDAIMTEWRGRTTMEEAALARAVLAPRGARRILLVTSNLHMRRARAVFERAGFEVYPAPADNAGVDAADPDTRIQVMSFVISELCARQYYALTGRL